MAGSYLKRLTNVRVVEYPVAVKSIRRLNRAAAGQALKSIVTGRLIEPPEMMVPKFGAAGRAETTGAEEQAPPAVCVNTKADKCALLAATLAVLLISIVQTRAFTGPDAELRDAVSAGAPKKNAVTDLGPFITRVAGLTLPLRSPPKLLKE
jgi:hypothetical protein